MMGELSFFLGLQVKQTKDGIFLCQSKYCKEILKKFEMESCKEASTPMPSSCYMDVDAAGKGVDQTKYRGLIGSLLYLTASRPNIMFAVCLCARYQANTKESHFKAAKRILKYLKGKTNVGLWYPSHSPIHLIGYSDSDFAGCKLDRKKTQVVLATFLVQVSFHGIVRSKLVWLSLLQRLNTLLLEVAVRKFSGLNSNLQILD